jgi:hypothetical protein
MLGRKEFTREEHDDATAAVEGSLAAYRELAASADAEALQAFEPLFCEDLALALDRRFVHRLRVVAGKDANAVNELELIADALLNNDGVFRTNKVIKWVPEATVLGLRDGDRIEIRADDFERLARAFLAELQARFVAPASSAEAAASM